MSDARNDFHVVSKTRGGTVSIVRNLNLAQARALQERLLPKHDFSGQQTLKRDDGSLMTISTRLYHVSDSDIVDVWILGPEGFTDPPPSDP